MIYLITTKMSNQNQRRREGSTIERTKRSNKVNAISLRTINSIQCLVVKKKEILEISILMDVCAKLCALNVTRHFLIKIDCQRKKG